ncbi:MAG: anthranilate synthase component I family protein [Blastochloris sp.]|nr:anthranilate synthase component I family protein [Blastochloris sp.]
MKAFPLHTVEALIHRPNGAGGFYAFTNSVEEISGTSADWNLLENKLRDYQVVGCDQLHPPGAAVGYFTYEGSFHFRFYTHVEVLSADAVYIPTEELQGGASASPHEWTTSHEREPYGIMVEAAQEFIREGNIYQVNLARSFSTQVRKWNGLDFFKALWHLTKAPYAGFLKFSDRELIAASPELFIGIQGREITTQPIKGTRPRGSTVMEDRQNALELATNTKEVAELVMITDLERNDLGAISEYGTVEVKELVRCRAYSHVFHLVSTITSRLRKEISPLQAVHRCFPGGSITGAPKKKAMEVIQQLEAEERGSYTGAFGYFGFDGSVQLGMTIRTCERKGEHLSFRVGSGITIDSDPVKEFEETNHKAKAMKDAYALYLSAQKLHLSKGEPIHS